MNKKDRPELPPKPEKKSEEKKTLLGDKARAGRLLSEKLRQILQEETELVETPDGERLSTKYEALVRLMVKMALGYKEVDIKTGKEVKHLPDRGMIQQVWDRAEGRAVPVNEGLGKRRPLPKKISDANKERLNSMAKKDNDAN
jgi:hypothetical protein